MQSRLSFWRKLRLNNRRSKLLNLKKLRKQKNQMLRKIKIRKRRKMPNGRKKKQKRIKKERKILRKIKNRRLRKNSQILLKNYQVIFLFSIHRKSIYLTYFYFTTTELGTAEANKKLLSMFKDLKESRAKLDGQYKVLSEEKTAY